jgi:hypothetical protein
MTIKRVHKKGNSAKKVKKIVEDKAKRNAAASKRVPIDLTKLKLVE